MRTRYLSKTTLLSCLSAFFIATFSLLAQSIIVCPKCAHEALPDARFCAHCGASIQNTETPTAAGLALPDTIPAISPGTVSPHASASLANTAPDPETCVKEDIANGVRFMTEGNTPNPAAALAALINARAIMAIAEPGAIDPDTRTIVLKGIITTREAISRVRTTCPRCNGKGQDDVVQNFSSLNNSRTPLVIGKRSCPMCGGRGSVLRLRKISEIKSLLATGRQMFADEALISERTKLGNAWISPAMASHLTVRQQAMLRHYTADPCSECAGLGKTDCNTCDNTGLTPCTAERCDNGTIRPPAPARANPRERNIESMLIVTPRICPVCKGTALTTCTQCAGTCSINCRRCNGSGERTMCTTCRGEGIQPCKACKGTGKDRQGQTCITCAGEGIILCTSCGGDGYGR